MEIDKNFDCNSCDGRLDGVKAKNAKCRKCNKIKRKATTLDLFDEEEEQIQEDDSIIDKDGI